MIEPRGRNQVPTARRQTVSGAALSLASGGPAPPPATVISGRGGQLPGYQASGDSLAATHKAISSAVSDAQQAFRMLGQTDLTKTDFGELDQHQQRYDAFTKSLAALGDGTGKVCDALNTFASKMDTSGKAYVNAESTNAANVDAAGGH